jgi:hypothetical protein
VPSFGGDSDSEAKLQYQDGTMNLIWGAIIAFGLFSLFILVVGIWAQLDMSKRKRQETLDEKVRQEKKP